MRLQRYLARCGVSSRRAAEELIRSGRVTVGGKRAQLGESVGAGEVVCVDGSPVIPPERQRTFLLYKPAGVVTTAQDELGRPGVLQRMPPIPGLFSIGRLDRDSEGLLLLTTDGALGQRIGHPSGGHLKTYRVFTDRQPSRSELSRLQRGIELEDGWSKPTDLIWQPDGFYLSLHEGRKRQIRRSLAALDLEVVRLVRLRAGGLYLGNLEPGRYRELRGSDLEKLERGERDPEEEARLAARWDWKPPAAARRT